MTLRKATLTVGILLALGLSVGTAKQAMAGGGCGYENGRYGYPHHSGQGYGYQRAMPAPGAYRYGVFPQRAVMMAPRAPHPAMYFGTEPAATVKTASPAPEKVIQSDIVDTALATGSFNMLVAALQAAELVDTLRANGPFTVFAPTDKAFAKVPQEQLEVLLGDKEALTKVLSYHVVPGKVLAADVAQLTSAETVQGGRVTIDTSEGVRVDGARVVKTDVLASNGVIHAIDSVIMPE
jgi:uncharacterized surface protein with fasciclin (FAS1) repeats